MKIHPKRPEMSVYVCLRARVCVMYVSNTIPVKFLKNLFQESGN